MTTATATTTATAPSRRTEVLPVTLKRVVASEWIKLRSLRSSVITIGVAFLLMVALSLIVPAVIDGQWATMSPANKATFDPTNTALTGFHFAQLAVGVLGVLLVTGEYATGMIRATFTAVPGRLPVLWAKGLVFTAVTFVTMTLASFAAFFAGQAMLHSKHLETTISAPGVLRAVLGAGLYLTVVGLLGVALGALIRNTAGAICTLVAGLFLLPLVVEQFGSSIQNSVGKFLPGAAGEAVLNVVRQPGTLAPWAGFAVLCGYTALTLAAAAFSLKRRDA